MADEAFFDVHMPFNPDDTSAWIGLWLRNQRQKSIHDVLGPLLENADLILTYPHPTWDAFTLKVWSDGFQATQQLAKVVDHWTAWIGGGWPAAVVGVLDIYDWRISTWDRWTLPHFTWPPLQQIPRTHGLKSPIAWWADCYPQWRRNIDKQPDDLPCTLCRGAYAHTAGCATQIAKNLPLDLL